MMNTLIFWEVGIYFFSIYSFHMYFYYLLIILFVYLISCVVHVLCNTWLVKRVGSRIILRRTSRVSEKNKFKGGRNDFSPRPRTSEWIMEHLSMCSTLDVVHICYSFLFVIFHKNNFHRNPNIMKYNTQVLLFIIKLYFRKYKIINILYMFSQGSRSYVFLKLMLSRSFSCTRSTDW